MRFLIIILVVLSQTTACTKNNENQESICFTRTATHLKIENNTNKVVYTTSFGQKILPLIYWAPTCGTSNIEPNNSISVGLSSINGYTDDDKLVVYWWECTNGEFQQIHNVILDSGQTICQ